LFSPPVADPKHLNRHAHAPPLLWCVRAAEYEADAIGIHLLAKACYDPDANISMLQKLNKVQEAQGMQQPELLSTHPLTEVRLQESRHADRLGMGGGTSTANSVDLLTCSSLRTGFVMLSACYAALCFRWRCQASLLPEQMACSCPCAYQAGHMRVARLCIASLDRAFLQR